MIACEDDAFENISIAAMLHKIFSQEPDSTRVMATYHFVDGMTLEATAHEMRMSVSGVRKRLRLLRQRLQASGMPACVSQDACAGVKSLKR
jgi:RNA polymerase sigma-70 factor (ECF subfamily)